MSVQAIRSQIERERPEISGGSRFTPEQPEDIIPYIGIIPMQYSYSQIHRLPLLTDEAFYDNGPPLEDFWLSRSIKGEAGEIRKGLPLGDVAYTAGGVALTTTVYRNFFDRKGEQVSIGLESSSQAVRRASTERKQLVGRVLFSVLNPAQAEPTVEYMDILLADMRRRSRAIQRIKDLNINKLLNNPDSFRII